MKTGTKIAVAVLAAWLAWEAYKLVQAGESLASAPFKALSGLVSSVWKSITGIFSGSGAAAAAAPVDLFPNYSPTIADTVGGTARTAWGNAPAYNPPVMY